MNKKTIIAAVLLISSDSFLSAGPCPENIREVWEESQRVQLDLIRKKYGDLELLEMLADGQFEPELFELVQNLDLSNCGLGEKSEEKIGRLFGRIKKFSKFEKIKLIGNGFEKSAQTVCMILSCLKGHESLVTLEFEPDFPMFSNSTGVFSDNGFVGAEVSGVYRKKM